MSDAALRLQQGLDLAFLSLNRRARTVLEIRQFLESKRIEPGTIDATVEELKREGYLDDARFASQFADDKRRLEQWGADRIERRLVARGVDRDVARTALAVDRESELDGALGVLRRRFPSPPCDARGHRSAYGVLVRKGYDPEVASDALRAYSRSGD